MTITYKKKAIYLVLAGILSVFAASSARTMADGMQSATIQATNNGCSPATLQVQPWTTVTWINTGSVPVSIISDNYFGSPISPGFTYIFTFSTPGQYHYSCTPLGTQITSGSSSMTNVIQVLGPGFVPGAINSNQNPGQFQNPTPPYTQPYSQPPAYTPTYTQQPTYNYNPTPTYSNQPNYNSNPTPTYPPYNYNYPNNGYQPYSGPNIAVDPLPVPPTYSYNTGGRYATGTIVNDRGTLYLIINNYKVMFTDWNTYMQMGYGNSPVVYGDTSQYPEWPNYRIGNPLQSHSWSTWLVDRQTGSMYYSCSQGMIPVPSWDVFTHNGGRQNMIMQMNQADYGRLYNSPPAPPMTYGDSRMY